MRLWHQYLIPYLDNKRLLGQHRECCALRGKGWGKKHSTVDYVFLKNPSYLVAYHFLIIKEMEHRGYRVDSDWKDKDYRGKKLGICKDWVNTHQLVGLYNLAKNSDYTIFVEHDNNYFKECCDNLEKKGIKMYESL